MNATRTVIAAAVSVYIIVSLLFLLQRQLVLFDEQQILALTGNRTAIAYNVTAMAQSDQDGNGPAYLVNGLSSTGYWYQIGLAYNWTFSYGNTKGFSLVYDIFNPDGHVVYPYGGGGGTINFNGTIRPGDKVLLELYFQGRNVTLFAKDWDTGDMASFSYSAENATEFVGPDKVSDINGTFTGLMTEWYHLFPYYMQENAVSYEPYGAVNSSGWLIADENLVVLQKPYMSLFISNSTDPVYPSQGYVLDTHNLSEKYTQGGVFATWSSSG